MNPINDEICSRCAAPLEGASAELRVQRHATVKRRRAQAKQKKARRW